MADGEPVSPEFEVDGLPCKSKKDLVTAGVGLPRGVQFIVKMRIGEHRIDAVRRKEKELHEALAYMDRLSHNAGETAFLDARLSKMLNVV